jgi:hypothetical protein
MPEYSCDCCNFSTTKKSTFNDHLTSKKHINNSKNTDDIIETNDTNKYLLQIKELENELKMKELQYQLKIQELENKLTMKELEIQNIKLQYQQPKINIPQEQTNNVQLIIKEQKDKIIKKETTLEKLNKRTKAMTITDFQENYLNDDTFNPFITEINFKDEPLILPKSINPNDYGDYIVVDFICKTLNNIPPEERPIYCSDDRRHHFYVKTNDGWLKYKQNKEVKHDILKILFWTGYKIIYRAFTMNLKEHPYYKWLLDKFYKRDNYDDNDDLNIMRIIKEIYPKKDDQDLHYSKFYVKLSEMTNNKNNEYKQDKTNKNKHDESDWSDNDNDNDNNDDNSYMY